jgi:hypothetical protein
LLGKYSTYLQGGDSMATQIAETLEFKTQIHKAWDATEQRMALRKYPRRSVSYDYYGMDAKQSQYLRALSYAKQNEKIEIPLWQASCRLQEAAFTDHYSIRVYSQDIWQFRGCSGVMFWHNDYVGGERYFINALYGDGSIKMPELLSRDYAINNTFVHPVSYGYLKPEDDYQSFTASNTMMQLNVDLLSDYSYTMLPVVLDEYHFEDWETKTPYQTAFPATYQNIDLFPLAPSWDADLPANFTRNANRLDNVSGVVKYDLKNVYASENKEIEYILATRSEINNFQRFFTKCKGRWKSFYAPTWLNDMTLVQDVVKGQSYMIVDWSLYWKYYSSMSRRKRIVLFLKSGAIQIVQVAGYSTDETGEFGKVYLDSDMSKRINKNDVVMISFLCMYRFDSDSLTTEYDTTGIARVVTTFTEVNA